MNSVGPNDQPNHQQIRKPPTPPPKPTKEARFSDQNRSAVKSDDDVAPQTAQGVRAQNGNFGDQKSVTVLEHQDSIESGIALDESFDESSDSMSEKENMSPDIKDKVGGQLFRAELEARLQKKGLGGHGDSAPKSEHEGSGIRRRAGKKWRDYQEGVKGIEPDGKTPAFPGKSPAEKAKQSIHQVQAMSLQCCKALDELKDDKKRYNMLSASKQTAFEECRERLRSKATIPSNKIDPFLASQYVEEVIDRMEAANELIIYSKSMNEAMELVKEKKPDLNKASTLFDQLDLEGMKQIFEHSKVRSKDLILVVNTKLLKLHLIEYSDEDGLFRTVGSPQGAKALTENMSKKLLTKVKTAKTESMESVPVLHQAHAKALASYAKNQLRNTYRIQGSSKENYMEVFSRLETKKDRIVFIDLLDAVHYFCSHLPQYSKETLSVETVDAALGPSLYGMGPKGSVEQFLEQWPLAKVEMMDSLKM